MVADTDKLRTLDQDSGRQLEEKLEWLRASYANAVAAPASSARRHIEKLLLFVVGEAAFGIRLIDVAQVLTSENLVAVPCAPPRVAGAIAYQQEAVGVLDLRSVLNIPTSGATANSTPEWLLVLRPLAYQCALAADAVLGVREVDGTELTLSSGDDESAAIVNGSVLIDGRSVATLDIDALATSVMRNLAPEHTGTRPEGVEYA